MVYSNVKTRLPWENRFRKPTVADLRDSCNKQVARLIEFARERLLAIPDAQETVEWQGVSWRWSLVYRTPGDAERPWAYLVPDPTMPRIAAPITSEMIGSLPINRLKKHVTEGLVAARRVGQTHWAVWDVNSKQAVEDVLDLLERKRRFVERPAEALSRATPTRR